MEELHICSSATKLLAESTINRTFDQRGHIFCKNKTANCIVTSIVPISAYDKKCTTVLPCQLVCSHL